MAVYATKRTPEQRDRIDVPLSTGASGLSEVADLGGMKLAGIENSTAWTSADIALLASPVSSAALSEVYQQLLSSSTAATILRFVTTANRYHAIPSDLMGGARFLQVASINVASTAAVAQAAARVVRLLLTPAGGPIK